MLSITEHRASRIPATLAVVSRPPSIPWDRIRYALACHPDGLTSPQVAAIAAPGPVDGKTAPALLCVQMLRRREALGNVRRAGRVPRRRGGGPIIWQLPRAHARQALKAEMALVSARIALLEREIRALTLMEEGIEELEQVEREIAALGPQPWLYR